MASKEKKGCCASCISILFTLGFFVFVYWLIFQPHQIRAYADTATLSTFSLNTTAPPSLSYNLNLTLSFRNPNRRIGVYYDRVSAEAFYAGSQLGATDTDFEPFYQHKKTTKVVYPAFVGVADNVTDGVRNAYASDMSQGAYNVKVQLRAKLRYKLWFVKIHGFKPKISCWLRFPVTANGGVSTAPFSKCHVDY